MAKKKEGRVLVIPDFHEPFSHPDAVPFLQRVAEEFSTNMSVALGDEIDSHAVSNYQSDPDGYSPGEEFDRAVTALKKKWYPAFPDMLVCRSNHTMRPWLKMQAMGLPRRLQPKLHDVLEAPDGWEWAEAWDIDDVVYEHGDAIQGGVYPYATAAMRNMRSTVIGHHHGAFGIHFHRTPYHAIFGMGAGCLINEDTYAMAYGRRHKKKPIVGCGVVLHGQPILVQMKFKRGSKRWNGKLGVLRTEEMTR
jgi:hypothetical protein